MFVPNLHIAHLRLLESAEELLVEVQVLSEVEDRILRHLDSMDRSVVLEELSPQLVVEELLVQELLVQELLVEELLVEVLVQE